MKYTDTELLDFLESEGNGIAVVHDDAEHWCVAADGFQQVVFNGPGNFPTSFMVPGEKFGRKTIREAIAAYIDDPDGYETATNEAYEQANAAASREDSDA